MDVKENNGFCLNLIYLVKFVNLDIYVLYIKMFYSRDWIMILMNLNFEKLWIRGCRCVIWYLYMLGLKSVEVCLVLEIEI